MRDPAKVATRVVLGVAALLVVWFVVAGLTDTRPHIEGSNGVLPTQFAVQLPAHERTCDTGASVPTGIEAVRLTIGTYGAKDASVHLLVPGVGAGPSVPLTNEGVTDVPVPPGAAGHGGGLCIVNEGDHRIALAGLAASPGLIVHGKPSGGYASLIFIDDAPGSWSTKLGAVLDQIGYAKGLPASGAVGVVVLLLLVAALAGALAAGWRYLRP